ncbi:MAG: hypothetical protein IID40_09390, partial [Planctomycetes bacterium]|nr:hypothetical protein [Planctomycetota bacterium]
MSTVATGLSQRERELAAIISSYNEVTDQLKRAHERLADEVQRLRDRLAQKDRELARKERLAALGEMAAGVAHEIRNPLGGIQLFASLLERDLKDQPKLGSLAAKISNGVRTLDGIVTDILAFAGPEDVMLGPVELGPLVEETLELAAPQQRARQVTLHVALSDDAPVVEANAPQLQRALLNLVFNAIDAAGAGGNVWITTRPGESDAWVHLEVADDGPGVPAELRERIFHPFYTGKDSGTGLGLAIVHRIAETHGPGVQVGDRPGGGAVFGFSLWRAERPPTGLDSAQTQGRGSGC